MGKEANLTSPDGTVQHRLGAELPLVSDYVNALRGAGLALHDLRAVVATPALCEQIPALEKLHGRPCSWCSRARNEKTPEHWLRGFVGGADGTRTRGLRRDRPAL
jgi:hypothetical protein